MRHKQSVCNPIITIFLENYLNTNCAILIITVTHGTKTRGLRLAGNGRAANTTLATVMRNCVSETMTPILIQNIAHVFPI